MNELLKRAAMLYGNGTGRSTKEIEEDMSAPDAELLEFAYPYLQELSDDRMAIAMSRAWGGDKR